MIFVTLGGAMKHIKKMLKKTKTFFSVVYNGYIYNINKKERYENRRT